MKRLFALFLICGALGGCGRQAVAKSSCASLDLQISADAGVPVATLDSFQKRLSVLLFDLAGIKSGNACHLTVSVISVAPGVLGEEPDPLHFYSPRKGAGSATISARLDKNGTDLWSGTTEMVFAVDTQSVKTASLLRTFFDVVGFEGAINPFAVESRNAVHSNLCRLSDYRLVPTALPKRIRVLRYVDLSTGGGKPCRECWSLLLSGGVEKILFDPLDPEEKEFEAAFGIAYRPRYLAAVQAHLNIDNALTGEPVLLSVIGQDQDRVPILHAEPVAGAQPDAVMSFDRLGINLGTNIGSGPGNGSANLTTTTFEDLSHPGKVETRKEATYGRGLSLGDCAAKHGQSNWQSVVQRFEHLNVKANF